MIQSSGLKINEAIELLNDAARLKKEEFSRILTDKVSGLKETVAESICGEGEALEGLRDTIEEAIRESEEAVLGSVRRLDEDARKNPWPYLGAAAAAALVFGFMVGNSKR